MKDYASATSLPVRDRYGYRGTPVSIPLGFDASRAPHRYAIEWDPREIRWFVDGQLVYQRAEWNPTPIPHLPMMLHVNTSVAGPSWHDGSSTRLAVPKRYGREVAGRQFEDRSGQRSRALLQPARNGTVTQNDIWGVRNETAAARQ
ncbi:MAG: family 16 glycosylhydrolase [Reyranella sp.]|nr:family 16 glycosylhydrolase [Reyranella sp.]